MITFENSGLNPVPALVFCGAGTWFGAFRLALRATGHTEKRKESVGMPFPGLFHLLKESRGIPGSEKSLWVCPFRVCSTC